MSDVAANTLLRDDSFVNTRHHSGETLLLVSGLGSRMIRWSAPFCDSPPARGCRQDRETATIGGEPSRFRGRGREEGMS